GRAKRSSAEQKPRETKDTSSRAGADRGIGPRNESPASHEQRVIGRTATPVPTTQVVPLTPWVRRFPHAERCTRVAAALSPCRAQGTRTCTSQKNSNNQ